MNEAHMRSRTRFIVQGAYDVDVEALDA